MSFDELKNLLIEYVGLLPRNCVARIRYYRPFVIFHMSGPDAHVPPLAATISRLAHVSEQPCRRHRSGRSFCPADDRIRDSLLSCCYTTRTTTLGIVWRDSKSDRGVDLAPDHRGFPVGRCASIPHQGSGRLVRPGFRAASACHGHSGSAGRTPITLAKCH